SVVHRLSPSYRVRKGRFRLCLANTPDDEIIPSGAAIGARSPAARQRGMVHGAAMVPGEGFEPPTFGLQNRCTATVLTRLIYLSWFYYSYFRRLSGSRCCRNCYQTTSTSAAL